MIKLNAAIFDLDGTLLDSMPLWLGCAERYISSLGLEPENDLGRKLFSMNMKEGADYLKKKYNLKFSEDEICNGVNQVIAKAYKEEVPFKAGADDFLQKLRKSGTKIALCTNTDRVIFTPALQRLNAINYFDFIFTASEMEMSKSQPEIFYKICDEMEVRPEDTWIFEDSLYALQTARQAGIKTCALYDETSENDAEQIKQISSLYCTNYKEAENHFFGR
ncbi:HAD family phosphatase [Treponema sp. C6A8]|uniref:HAD family hydrolase n=1 Tax=Treponema sp. C6A8 TaxID=1410609 RepID=UPI0006877C0D|nr:HAD family phosphatase [Treponema sp. C6A8]